MIPGVNSKVSQGGVEYHVQTEDLGRKHPFVLTLVFRGGAIIAREKVNYREKLGEEASDEQIKSFMDEQHRRVMRDFMAGQIQEHTVSRRVEGDPPHPPAPLAESPLPLDEKSLDELIAEYLRRRRTAGPR